MTIFTQMHRPSRVFVILGLTATLSGCGWFTVDHSGLRPPDRVGTVAPAQFCAGDELTASFDITAPLTCPPALAEMCAPLTPNVDISSNPAAFPPTRINGYSGELSFLPPANSVDVTFAVDREQVVIPTEDFHDGDRVVHSYSVQTSTVHTASRIDGIVEEELIHDGMCAGSRPVNATAELPGLPRLSPRLVMVGLCNLNPVSVVVTLEGGRDTPFRLTAGQCMPPGTAVGRMVAIRPEIPDISARCGLGVDADVPPRTLRTSVQLACPAP